MQNLLWDLYDGSETQREQCAEILAISFLVIALKIYQQNNSIAQILSISKEEAKEFYIDQLDKGFFGWVFVFYREDQQNQGLKQFIGVSCANDMHDFLQYEDEIQPNDKKSSIFLKQNAFYAIWARAKNVKKNEFFYTGDIVVKADGLCREQVFYSMMVEITRYFQSQGYLYGIVKGLKPINNGNQILLSKENVNKKDVITIQEQDVSTENKRKKQILYAGKTEFLLNTFNTMRTQELAKL